MDMQYVDSSTVDQIGFDEHCGEVHVIFKRGDHYVYSDVTLEVWEQFRAAPSQGGFLNQEFKAKGYVYRKL